MVGPVRRLSGRKDTEKMTKTPRVVCCLVAVAASLTVAGCVGTETPVPQQSTSDSQEVTAPSESSSTSGSNSAAPTPLNPEDHVEAVKKLAKEGPAAIDKAYNECDENALANPDQVEKHLGECFADDALVQEVQEVKSFVAEAPFTRRGSFKFMHSGFRPLSNGEFAIDSCVNGQGVDFLVDGEVKISGKDYESFSETFHLKTENDKWLVTKVIEDPAKQHQPCWPEQ